MTGGGAGAAAPGANGTFGYASGGFGGSHTAGSEKVVFATNTLATATSLSSARYGVIGISDVGAALYMIGGVTSGGRVTTTDKFNSGETRSTLATGISSARQHGSVGMSNTEVAGYVAGGDTGSAVTTTDKLTYSTDVFSTVAAHPAAMWSYAGISDDATAGYTLGGALNAAASSVTSAIHKRNFSTDAASTLSATLTSARFGAAGLSRFQTAGYSCGGHAASYGSTFSQVRKLAYSTETESAAGTLPSALGLQAGMSDPSTDGWMLYGYTGGANSNAWVRYAFDTETPSTSGSSGTSKRAVGGAQL